MYQFGGSKLARFDTSVWYKCQMSSLDGDLRRTFLPSQLDETASEFLDRSQRTSNSICLQIFYRIAMAFLCVFMSLTDMNGLLGHGATYVFSSYQLRKLIDKAGVNRQPAAAVLDVGAGDGTVTDQIKSVFGSTISVTEVSPTMRRTLRRKGYRILDVNQWHRDGPFDYISLLNVLDRCDKPKSLLQDIHNALQPNDGILLLAVVLPFEPFVRKGPRKVAPNEKLQIKGRTFEDSLNSLLNDILRPVGFRVLSWTRLPYFYEGDLFEPYYVLDNVLLMLKRFSQ